LLLDECLYIYDICNITAC